mmetsp:Transcript_16518/g.47540  ORF Transcript_16518/g.47540 Transcript_16518/m.47540 type:complete len:249 (+) Transcript_16518:546-1292(+)
MAAQFLRHLYGADKVSLVSVTTVIAVDSPPYPGTKYCDPSTFLGGQNAVELAGRPRRERIQNVRHVDSKHTANSAIIVGFGVFWQKYLLRICPRSKPIPVHNACHAKEASVPLCRIHKSILIVLRQGGRVRIQVTAWWENEVVLPIVATGSVVPLEHVGSKVCKVWRNTPRNGLTGTAATNILLLACGKPLAEPCTPCGHHIMNIVTITNYKRNIRLVRVILGIFRIIRPMGLQLLCRLQGSPPSGEK